MVEEGIADLRPATSYLLPRSLRAHLAGDHGPLVQTDGLRQHLEGAVCVAAVGDVVSVTLRDLGVVPQLFVCDFKTQRGEGSTLYRERLGDWGDHAVRVANPAATVTREAWDAVRDAFGRAGTTRIEVDGEEDLLGIPVFLEAPLGAKVLYGAPGRGIVVVSVDAAFKRRVADLVAQFDVA